MRSIVPGVIDATTLLLASGLSGFALLGLEVVWFRFLSLVLNDTPLAFAVLLATVLLGIAIGGALAGAFASKLRPTASLASALAFVTGALGLLSYRFYGGLVQGSFSFDQNVFTVSDVQRRWSCRRRSARARSTLGSAGCSVVQRSAATARSVWTPRSQARSRSRTRSAPRSARWPAGSCSCPTPASSARWSACA